jgi:hypothetical protein
MPDPKPDTKPDPIPLSAGIQQCALPLAPRVPLSRVAEELGPGAILALDALMERPAERQKQELGEVILQLQKQQRPA